MPYFSRNYCKAVNLGSALVLLFILFLFALMTGCTTARKVEKWNANNPVKAAAYCAKTFPPVEWVEVIRDTLTDTTIAFYPEWVFDTLYVGPDTVVMKAKCPPSKTITKTIRDSVKVRVRDSAAVYALQGELQAAYNLIEADKKLIQKQDELIEAGRKFIIRLILLIIALGVWIFRKPLLRAVTAIINPVKGILK